MPTRRTRKGAGLPKKTNNSRRRRRRARNRVKKANVLLSRNAEINGMSPMLSPCSEFYARGLTIPFDGVPDGKLCIPDAITLPSNKFKCTCRGTFQIGTAGVGWIVANPFTGVCSNSSITGSVTNAVVVKTTNAFTGTQIAAPGAAGTVVQASNSQYGKAFFSDPFIMAQTRLVGSGLRCRYMGTELNRAGRLVCWRTRGNSDIPVVDMSGILQDNYYSTVPVDRNWHQITYTPTSTSDISYSAPDFPTDSGINRRVLAVFVDGAVAGVSFEFEWVGHYEMIANDTNIPTSPSHSDPVGFGAILSALPSAVHQTGKDLYNTVKAGALKALGHSVSGLFARGAAAIGSALLGPVGGAAAGMGTKLLAGPLIEEVE